MKYITAAKPITNPAIKDITNKSGSDFFSDLLPALVTLGFVIGSLIFVFFLITGAITWMTSGGDKSKLESARGRLSSALIGFILLLVVFALIQLIEKFFNINILLLDIEAIKIR